MDWLPVYGTALLLGSVHAFETDHLAAVTAFVLRRPTPHSALRYCLRWAIGHGTSILIAGGVVLAIGLTATENSTQWAERCVGLALLVLGGWTVWGARNLHAHRHVHNDGTVHLHLHSHAHGESHNHGHGATVVGLLHGLAGTAPAVALIPLATFDSIPLAFGYLVLFAVGTAAGMALYGLLAGFLAGQAVIRSERFARMVAVCTGSATAIVGVIWLVR